MKYIIMADGKGKRWHNYKNIPKHFIEVNGEKIIERTVRLLNEFDKDSEVIITSHDERYEIKGSKRYEPKHNILEIDRFTSELIEDNICFLYGDTYYSDKAIEKIIKLNTDDLMFFGNGKSIVAIKIKDSDVFTKHVENVRKLYLEGKIEKCIGWQVYQSFQGISFKEKEIKDKYVYIHDDTQDFNSPKDYEKNKGVLI
ncbi:2-C-methyl-D-erythritol 4-phosphate cytidylyltransferase [Anaerofustis sp. NSJ-163]|uniref:2-C-methyl-D-erythritol 4-phosphate cytidylyltransferase n=1 Tax=Anaerofustis sp. NSJ-163 TaxID=2944391 RepID=UPI00209C465F|nr:2-C-methyl-D-erythritol 4-phosphate cytidylyltransferase [Anaerofustis sp. NSJ-163]MCO8194789.1 2-C-methyl-D-erythritol 4-phosphate cytidylyltransferase [Anaerofustis sp. NSJ-163]